MKATFAPTPGGTEHEPETESPATEHRGTPISKTLTAETIATLYEAVE